MNLLAAQVPDTERWWVLSSHEIWYLALFVLIFSILVFLLRNRAQLLKMFRIETDEVLTLRNELADMKRHAADLETQIRSMQLVINMLLERSVMVPDSPLPVKLDLPPEVIPALKKRISRPVLLVYGVDEFGEQDRQALRRAGVTFFRLKSASLEDLRTELQRRRSDGNLYDVVHVSSHGSDKGILLESELVNGSELSEILSGVRTIFLGTCNNQKIADKLVGIVKYVIVVYEEIDTNDASAFVFEFYKRYKTNLDVEAAFSGAIGVMPHISEFVDLRIGGD